MAAAPTFTTEPLLAIVAHARATTGPLAFRVLDPDHGRGHYSGERVTIDGVTYVHRPFRLWVELADRLGLRLLTPRPTEAPLIELHFEALDRTARWQDDGADVTEKYGTTSGFARITKLEDPAFVVDFDEALGRVRLPPSPRILDLGVNTGDELALLLALSPALVGADIVGVDHSASAIAAARDRFAGPGFTFVEADIASIGDLGLGHFDLVISIGTLQSPGIDDRDILRQLVQHHLTADGGLILGFPNCRYFDGEVQLGARMKNFRDPELGLVIKDIAFYRKYLQQHRRRVHVTGSRYLLVTAIADRPRS